MNETDKVIRSPEGDLYRRAGNELGAKMKGAMAKKERIKCSRLKKNF
jgi:hypothetical protein